MANLDNGFNVVPRFIELPGTGQAIGIWRVKALSASDTLTVPELDFVEADIVDQSSVRVLEPASGVTASAAATTGNRENVITVVGAVAGQELILLTVHIRGRDNVLAQPGGAVAASDSHTNSVDFDGLTEFLSSGDANAFDADFGQANQWTWGIWAKNLGTAAAQKELMLLQNISLGGIIQTFVNVIDGSTADFEVLVRNDNGDTIKSFLFPDAFAFDTWVSIFLVFNAGTFTVYLNGEEATPTITTDDPGNMVNDPQAQLTIAGEASGGDAQLFEGRFYEAAIWTTPLTAPEILTLHANDAGGPPVGDQDLAVDHGAYVSSDSLSHWYRLGINENALGEDFGSNPVDLDFPVNLDASDIDPDYPQGGAAPPDVVLTPSSIDFNGSNEVMSTAAANTPDADLDIAEAWTWAVWAKITDFSAPIQALMSRQNGVGSEIYFSVDAVDVNSGTLRLNVTSFDSGASKQYEFNDVININTWHHIAATYDETETGAQFVVYLDGVALVPDVIGTDDELVMIDELSQITFAANASYSAVTATSCRIFESALFAFPLTPAQIAFLAANPDHDPTTDSLPDYNVSSACFHWWRFGYDPDNIGIDYGVIPTVDLDVLTNIDATDISADIPT